MFKGSLFLKKMLVQQNKKSIIEIVMSVVFILSVIIGYYPEPYLILELTCISNFSIGILLLCSAMMNHKKNNKTWNILFQTAVVTINLVLIITILSFCGMMKINMSGAFFFLHLVNPLVFIIYYFVYVDAQNEASMKKVFIAPIFCVVYFVLDYIVGKLTGEFVYGMFEVSEVTFIFGMVFVLIMYSFLLICSLVFYYVNKYLHRNVG